MRCNCSTNCTTIGVIVVQIVLQLHSMIVTPATTVVPRATLQLKVGWTDAVCNLRPPTQRRPLSGYISWWSIERHCWYHVGTGSPKWRWPILLERSDLILTGSFDPYLWKRKPRRQRTGALCVQHSPTAATLSTSFLLNRAPQHPKLNAVITRFREPYSSVRMSRVSQNDWRNQAATGWILGMH